MAEAYNLDITKLLSSHKVWYIFCVFILVSRLSNKKVLLFHHGSSCFSTKLDYDAGTKWSLYVLRIFISQKLYSLGTFAYRGGPTQGGKSTSRRGAVPVTQK